MFFLLLVTTYISFSNIITFIFENKSTRFPFMGGMVLIINYVVYLLGLTYAVSLRNYKRQFEIAAITYTIGYALYIYDFDEVTRLVVSIIAAVIGGYGASVLWVSQGGYMVKLFKTYSISEHAEGRYMAIQNGIIYGQVMLGGVVTTFALGIFGDQIYFMVLTIIGTMSLLFVHFFLDPLKEPIPDDSSMLQSEESVYKQTFCSQLLNVFRYYSIMKHIAPAMILGGLLLGFTTTNFKNLLKEEDTTTFNIGLLHISNGLGAIIGGYLSGYLSGKMAILKEGVFLFSIAIVTLGLTFLIRINEFETIFYALFIAFLWGISLYFLEGWLFVASIKLFGGAIEAFAVVKQMQTLSFITFQGYYLIVNQEIDFFETISLMLALALFQLMICLYKTGANKVAVLDDKINEDSSPDAINRQ